MRTRAIRDLAQLSDQDFFSEVSSGIDHVLRNAVQIERDAQLLGEHERAREYHILSAVVKEEAAKILILLDAVRCPRNQADHFSRQLGRFHNHLAKGIYAEVCDWRPATFGELISYVDRERREFFLDGPNDVDWILRNEILQGREEMIYVDYVCTDDGHQWWAPYDGFPVVYTPGVLRLVQAFSDLGCTTPEALLVIANLWRPVVMTAEYHWADLHDLNAQTLEELASRDLLRGQRGDSYRVIVDDWSFPLFSVDLGLVDVNQDDLREIQQRWVPDG